MAQHPTDLSAAVSPPHLLHPPKGGHTKNPYWHPDNPLFLSTMDSIEQTVCIEQTDRAIGC